MQPDIIVIGAGGAGLVAAIAARKAGAEVLLLSKTRSGMAGCTAYAGGGFTLAAGSVSPEAHFAKTMETGRHLSCPDLVGILAEEGEQALQTIQSWGVTLRIRDGHATVRPSAPTSMLGGAGLTRELTEIACAAGVKIIEGMVATKLLVEDDKVVGLEWIDWQNGCAHVAPTGAVIMATGGAGQIYSRTDNPSRITGDGYALALEAGLPLRDMEFVQFYPLGLAEPGFPSWMIGLPILDRVRLTDGEGNEFWSAALAEWGLSSATEANLYARDRAALLLGEKLWKGDKCLLHLNELPEESWQEPALTGLRRLYPVGVNPWEHGPIRVAPIQHYFTGGMEIDSSGRTALSGLYACGEVTGGVDGASRIGGNALTNIVTFGLRAGRTAALEAPRPQEATLPPTHSESLLEQFAGGRQNVAAVRRRLQAICQKGLGPVRNAAGLAEAISSLDDLYPQVRAVRAQTGQERLLALELLGLWMSARAVAQAALAREESRGVHYRSDFPGERSHWQRYLKVCWQGGQMVTKL